MNDEVPTVIIGGGQAGLAVGYHLARRHHPFVILDERARVGDVWRERYDSLRLFSPARGDALPGKKFPGRQAGYPTGRQMADYLEDYAATMALPVRGGVRAERVTARPGGGYVVRTTAGDLGADEVVVATGGHRRPYVPEIAADLDPGIRQLHSAEYRRPDQLQDGPALVVGASHSGADLALEVAATHRTYLSGRIPGELPVTFDRPSGYVADLIVPKVFLHVLTLRTPLGRKVAPYVKTHGAPLLRVKKADLLAAGVEHLPARTATVVDGRPALTDGRVLDVRNVLWCTGYREDFSWVEPAEIGADGLPVHRRGVVEGAPGLYFLGLPFQYALASMLIVGIGRDAEHIARHLTGRRAPWRDPARVAVRA